MVTNPASGGGALALACTAVAARVARCAVKVVLVHLNTSGAAELAASLGSTTDETAGRGVGVAASPGVVAIEKSAHHRPALVIATGTLATSAGQALARTATGSTVLLVLVFWASTGVSGTFFLAVTLAGAGATYGIGRGELAFLAAAVVGIIADGVTLELARLGVAARVVTAAFLSTTVAVLAGLDDAISTLASTNGSDPAVVGQTAGFDAVTAQGGADVANCTTGEIGHTGFRIWVHDVFRIGVTGR